MKRDLVDALIACEKKVTAKPKKEMYSTPNNAFVVRNEFSCISVDAKKTFEVFMRLNLRFPQQFSIGLRYRSEDGSCILCRYNGNQEHTNKLADRQKFHAFHIHKLFDQQLSNDTDSILDAEPTTRYVTFEEALYCFLNDCHIQEWQKYFPDLENKINQLHFPLTEE